MSKSAGKGKKGGGLRMFWIPTGGHKSHKHKKSKYYRHGNFDSPNSAMMSGDSPNSHKEQFFDFKEGRSTPPPTTSKDIAIQNSSVIPDRKTEIIAASVLAEPPLKEFRQGTNYIGISSEQSDCKNDEEILATEDKAMKDDSNPEGSDQSDKRDVPKKINGTMDSLDAKWIPPPDGKKEEDEEESSCMVNCLYYTMQCCECTIM